MGVYVRGNMSVGALLLGVALATHGCGSYISYCRGNAECKWGDVGGRAPRVVPWRLSAPSRAIDPAQPTERTDVHRWL